MPVGVYSCFFVLFSCFLDSGERVSNAWVTYPGDRDNSPKGLLIPDDPSAQLSEPGLLVWFFQLSTGQNVQCSRMGPRPIS